MNNRFLSFISFVIAVLGVNAVGFAQLYTEGPGTNPPFEDIRNNISNGFSGTDIDVNNALVEGGAYGQFGIQSDIKIHTLASSVLGRNVFGNWSRWYQEDGATQVFRLFPGEENVRNSRPLAARIEAFDTTNRWNVDDGQWFEWVGRYTILKPINAAIFQVKDVDAEAWSLQLNMDASGKIVVQHRTPFPGQEKRFTLIENAIGQPFDIRIRDNGLDYEVYLNNEPQPRTVGQYVRNADPGDNSDTTFRWGIYVGAKEVQSEAMIFISHATVNPDIEFPTEPPVEPVSPGALIAGWDTWANDGIHAPNVTDGITLGTTSKSGFSRDTDQRASTDGTWGTLDTPAADVTADDSGDTVRLTNGSSGYYDFTIMDTGGADRNLLTFHFDAGTFRPNSARNYELSVLSGDLTLGTVATGVVSSVAGGQQDWSDFDIPLTGLADHTLDADGMVTFRLEFTGGTPGAGGHHQSLDNVAVTAEVPTTLIAGWDSWDQVSADTWDATVAMGVMAQAVGMPEAGGSWFNFNNGTVDNGASSDGAYGDTDFVANPSVAAPTDGVTLSNGFDGHIDFTLTNTTGAETTLSGFHFDIGAFRSNAANDWELEVLPGGALTAGSLATGTATVNAGPMQDDENVSLLELADNVLDANGSVTFRLSFTGGGGGSGSAANGHHLFLDNVGVSAVSTGTEPGLLGDFDGDGDVDLVDLDQYSGNIGAAGTGDLEALDLDGDGMVSSQDFATHYKTLLETSNGQTGTFAGDLNLDGTVDVLGDAFALVGNLGNASATSWSQGDINGDGKVDVLGDAFALVANLGRSNE